MLLCTLIRLKMNLFAGSGVEFVRFSCNDSVVIFML